MAGYKLTLDLFSSSVGKKDKRCQIGHQDLSFGTHASRSINALVGSADGILFVFHNTLAPSIEIGTPTGTAFPPPTD